VTSLHVPILTRAYNERLELKKRSSGSRPATERASEIFDRNVLVYDTEETADVEQKLLYGTYLLHRERSIIEEGVFYADDLSRAKKGRIRRWAESRGVVCCSQRDFYWEHVHHIRRDGGLLAAFNTPFDTAAIMPLWRAAGARKEKGRFLGGWTFNTSWKGRDGSDQRLRHPLVVKRLNAHAAIFDIGPQGRALDVRALYWALTNQGGSLKTISDALKTPHRKTELETYGEITDEALDYARNDTIVTAECLWILAGEFERHPIPLHPADAISPAAIIKSYYRAAGITPLRDRLHLTKEVSGAAFSGYYGARVEAPIVRQILPIVKLDALSMYPTVVVLLGLWSFVIAEGIDPVDATDEARAFLDTITYEDLLDPERWKELCAIVEIEPVGDLLPVRASYAKGHEPNIALNYLHALGNPLWFALPDLIVCKLLGKTIPRIRRAIRFRAGGPIDSLTEIDLLNKLPIKPGDDMARLAIELRKIVANDKNLSDAERDRLDSFLKVLANSGFYGVFAQVTRDETNGYDADYLRKISEWRDRVAELAERTYADRMSMEAPYWEALDACGGRIAPDVRFDARHERWMPAGEFADVPRHLLRRNTKRPASGEAYGNLDEIAQHVRVAIGDQGITTSDVLEFFRDHPWPPSRTLAQKGARNELLAERPDPPRTRVEVIGRECYLSDVRYPEDPGPFFCAPIATLVTAGARLLLAMMQYAVEREGGKVGYMDTDSAFVPSTKTGGLVACPNGPLRLADRTAAIQALSWEKVDDIRRELGALLPYDRDIVGEHIFKLEPENFALDAHGKVDRSLREQLYLYALAEKRYAVFNLSDGAVRLRDCKEHGLGLYLDPKGDKGNPKGWMWDVWQWGVEKALGLDPADPTFFDRPAVARLVFSTPMITRPFDDLSLGARIHPFRFMLTASAHAKDASLLGMRTRYVAPFEKDPNAWARLPWVNLYSHEPLAREARVIGLTTIGQYIREWEARARVVKMVTPSGSCVTVETHGLLVPTHVTTTDVLQTGRETVDSEPIDPEEIDWRDVLDEGGTEQPVGATMRHQVFLPENPDADDELRAAIKVCGNIARVARTAKVGRQTIYDFLAGAQPDAKTRKRISAALLRHDGQEG
jgi:DNA-binding phage protein